MSAAEFVFWGGFRRRYGLPAERLEAGIAIAGVAVCRTLGSKPKVSDLIPQFESAGGGDITGRLRVFLSGLKSAKSRHIPKSGEPFDTTPKRPAAKKRGLRVRQ